MRQGKKKEQKKNQKPKTTQKNKTTNNQKNWTHNKADGLIFMDFFYDEFFSRTYENCRSPILSLSLSLSVHQGLSLSTNASGQV